MLKPTKGETMSKTISEKKVSKKLAVLLAVLVAVLAASYALHPGSALAQEEKEQAKEEKMAEQEKSPEAAEKAESTPEPPEWAIDNCSTVNPTPESCETPPPVPPADAFETFSFELTVEGEPPAGARFFGSVPLGSGIGIPLADPDGDGTYTGSTGVPKFPPGPRPPDAEPVELPVKIVRTTGTVSALGPDYSVIKDFGVVPVDEDRTFRADVSFEDTEVEEPEEPGDEMVPDILVKATGVLEEQGTTTYMYGTHTVTDEASGTLYALKSNTVDLDGYAGERVTVSGGLVAGYENGQVEGGPPLLDVTDVRTAEGREKTIKVTFELTVDGEVPPVHDLYVQGDRQGVPEGSFGAVLCTTDIKDGQGPLCKDGGTYSKTYEAPAGTVVSYKFYDKGYTRSYGLLLSGQKAFYEDATVRATYPPPVEPPPEPGTTTPDPGNNGPGDGGFLSSTVDGVRNLLPSTGGLPLALLIAGAVLIPGGLLIRKLAR